MAKHKFKRAHTMPPRGAPMRAEEAANTAGDPQQEMPPPGAPTAAGPAPGAMPAAMPAAMPQQATGGSVTKVSRMSKMYGPKRVARNA